MSDTDKKQSFITVSSDVLEGYRGEVRIYSGSGKPLGVANVASGSGTELNLREATFWQKLRFRLDRLFKP